MSFAQGLRVIGTFIRCPVYNKPRGLDAKSACGSKRPLVIPEIMKMGAEGAVIIITGLHHFFLPDMISKLLCFIINFQTKFSLWQSEFRHPGSLPWLKWNLRFLFGCIYIWVLVPSWGLFRYRTARGRSFFTVLRLFWSEDVHSVWFMLRIRGESDSSLMPMNQQVSLHTVMP